MRRGDIKIYDCIQGTEEWLELRKGKMTASHALSIATQGKGLDTYCRKLAAEIYTGIIPPSYKNEDMQRGNDEEQFAAQAYELETGNRTQIIGFAEYNQYVGCSPDRLVGKDGGLEIKRKTFDKHNDLLLGAVNFESEYIWQCHMNMLIFDRSWWDLVSYNPDFRNKCLFILRVLRNEECDHQLLQGFEKGEKIIKDNLLILQSK